MFNVIAPFYDELMHAVPYDMWTEYLLLLLAQRDVRPKSILDVCCGTGIVTQSLAAKGYEMAGVDLSAPMIVEAKRKAVEADLQIHYLASDAATFDFGRKYECAYSFFDSFNYITDLGHLKKAIENTARHLESGAPFIFDLNTAYAFEAKMFDQQDTRKKTRVQYRWVGDYNSSTRIIEVAMKFWVDGKEYEEKHIQRAHTREEIDTMLLGAGFEQIEVFDSYTLDHPRKQSDRVHFVCLKS